jgi:hypothetical protein
MPFAGCEPELIVPKPLDRPGHDLVGDILIGVPLILVRIVQAKRGEIRLVAEAIHMGHLLAGAARVGAERRIEDRDADIGILKPPLAELPPPEVADADAVGLADGLERPLPDTDPVGVEREPKLRERGPEFPVLLTDR